MILNFFEKIVNKNDSQLHKKKTCTNNHSQQCFLRNVKRMKKKQGNCKRCQAVKRCIFRVRSTGKQEMLQTRTLLSEQTLQTMLNNGLERPCPLNVRAHMRKCNVTGPSLSSPVYENITVH